MYTITNKNKRKYKDKKSIIRQKAVKRLSTFRYTYSKLLGRSNCYVVFSSFRSCYFFFFVTELKFAVPERIRFRTKTPHLVNFEYCSITLEDEFCSPPNLLYNEIQRFYGKNNSRAQSKKIDVILTVEGHLACNKYPRPCAAIYVCKLWKYNYMPTYSPYRFFIFCISRN